MTLKVVDRFTVRSGLWEVDPRPYGLTKEAFNKYRSWDIAGAGGDHHIFVHHKPGTTVHFRTEGREPVTADVIIDATGWCNFPMFRSSEYWPPNEGPWIVEVNGVEVARGLGLPEGYHVSTFLIVDDIAEGSQPGQQQTVSHIQVIVDDVMVFDNWRDK